LRGTVLVEESGGRERERRCWWKRVEGEKERDGVGGREWRARKRGTVLVDEGPMAERNNEGRC